jgi:cupin 2 domain-containing protein
MKNLFDNIPDNLKDEFFETLVDAKDIKIERIVSEGHCSDKDFWYDQQQNEWIVLLQGEAELEFEEEIVKLQKGDSLLIEAHKKHRVIYTSTAPKAIWLAVHWKKES